MTGDIEITLNLWGRDRQIRVTRLQGGGYHLYVDSFFQGMIMRREGRLIFQYITGCDLTGDDLQGLLDVL